MTKIAILASGRGTNAQALVRAISQGSLRAEVVCVLSDRGDAGVLELDLGVKKVCVPPNKDITDRDARRTDHEERVLAEVRGADFLCLAGYMRLLSPEFIQAFQGDRGYSRIVNMHPSLLPAFKGKDGYAQAFDYGCKVAGATVHLVDEHMDNGPVLDQASFSLEGFSTAEAVEERGLTLEHELYVRTLAWVLPEAFELKGRRIVRTG